MKREDKREEAAYLNVIDVCGCGNCPRTGDCQLSFSLMCDKGKAYIRGFMAGSDWSDENRPSVIRDEKDVLQWCYLDEIIPIYPKDIDPYEIIKE